jgi:hypothetical protein
MKVEINLATLNVLVDAASTQLDMWGDDGYDAPPSLVGAHREAEAILKAALAHSRAKPTTP